MKIRFYFTLILLLHFFNSTLTAQSISISGGDDGLELQFSVANKTGKINKKGFNFYFPGGKSVLTSSWVDFNDSKSHGSFLKSDMGSTSLSLFDNSGHILNQVTFENITSDDKALQLYHLDAHHALLQYNVAQFEVYNSFGQFVHLISNTKGTDEGELVSKATVSTDGQLFVMYNPVIFTKDGKATSATLVDYINRKIVNLYFDNDYETVAIQYDPQFQVWIAVLNHVDGDKGKVYMLNNLGMMLYEQEADFTLLGATISSDFKIMALYSSGRMQAYNMMNGKRLGSSSVRGNPIFFAFYHPQKNYLIGLSSGSSGNSKVNISATVVDLTAKKINTVKSNNTVTLLSESKLYLKPIKNGYQLMGGYKPLNLKF